MRTLKIFLDSTGLGHPAHPNLSVAYRPNGIPLQEVTEIPDDVPTDEVIRLFNGTANVTWVFDPDKTKDPFDRGRRECDQPDHGHGRRRGRP